MTHDLRVKRHPEDPTPRYVFVDGHAFEGERKRMIGGVHGDLPPIDFENMRSELGAVRVLWYDALYDVDSDRAANEASEEQRERQRAKAAERRKFLEEIQTQDGFVLRHGTSRGTPGKNGTLSIREKEVDTLLAVEAMFYAARETIKHAILIGSDLDHRPLVEYLMLLGVYVTVYSTRNSSDELRRAPDSFKVLEYEHFYNWSGLGKWKSEHPKVRHSGRFSGGDTHVSDISTCPSGQIRIETMGRSFQGYLVEERDTWSCEQMEPLKRFLAMKYKVADWSPQSA